MLLKIDRSSAWLKAVLALLILQLVWIPVRLSFAAPSAGVATPSAPSSAHASVGQGQASPAATITGPNGITYQICQTSQCFPTREAKAQWAASHNCRFLEDVCTPGHSSTNSPSQDPGLWGTVLGPVTSAFNSVVGTAYDFSKGVFDGVKQQLVDLWNLVSNPVEVAEGIYHLGKAFFQDPSGTVTILLELLGQGAVDTITRASQCGAYDLGNVIGQYVSPAVALKLMGKLAKTSGRLRKAVDDLKKDIKCASFAAGTLISTPNGPTPIEQIAVGDIVHSRSEVTFADAPRRVENTFDRIAPGYRIVTTDVGSFTVTDEHPLWVQGKGWTEVKDVVKDDVIAREDGDALVRSNVEIAKPIRVYNFSVAITHSYFAGGTSIWAHNSNCELPPPYKAPPSPSNYTWGQSDGGPGVWREMNRDGSVPAWLKYEKQITGAPLGTEYVVNGKNFDGYDHVRGVLLDPKNHSANHPLLTANPNGGFYQTVIRSEVKSAQDFIDAAGGIPIEWHHSDKNLVEILQRIFPENGITEDKLKVVYTPDIVN